MCLFTCGDNESGLRARAGPAPGPQLPRESGVDVTLGFRFGPRDHPTVKREAEVALLHLRMRAPAPLLLAVNLARPQLFRRDLWLNPSETAPGEGEGKESNKR